MQRGKEMFNISVTPEEIAQQKQNKLNQQKAVEQSAAKLGMTKQNILNNALSSKLPSQGAQIQSTATTNGWGANANA